MAAYVRGGAWSNIEDEILKAAVQKYGTNQWARVSSLLPRKTDLQAKARWNEWLDPTINKSAWTALEDKKLIDLTKLLPNQWRTIASSLGRTATQCIERYQKLIEEAAGLPSNDLRLSGPGIETLPATGQQLLADVLLGADNGGDGSKVNANDPNFVAEAQPARPDEEDLEDDEREMLAEAKARLANTQGKKAKRKARERMLEESKRIALLQKRRDMKAAGLSISLKSKNKRAKKDVDYVNSIPFEVVPAQGPYDVSEEMHDNIIEANQFKSQVARRGISLKEVNDKIKTQQHQKKEFELNQNKKKRELKAEESKGDNTEPIQFKKRKTDGELTESYVQESTGERTEALMHPKALKPNKKLLPLLKGLFSRIPKALHEKGVPKFKFADEEEGANTDNAGEITNGSHAESLSNSGRRGLQEQREKYRPTQVAMQKLPIPTPSSASHIDNVKDNFKDNVKDSEEHVDSDLVTLIHAEIEKLISYDYENSKKDNRVWQIGSSLNDNDDANGKKLKKRIDGEREGDYDNIYNQIYMEIEEELVKMKKEPHNITYELPKSFATAKLVISKVRQLDQANEEMQTMLATSSHDFERRRKILLKEISRNQMVLMENSIALHVAKARSKDEKVQNSELQVALEGETERLYERLNLKQSKD